MCWEPVSDHLIKPDGIALISPCIKDSQFYGWIRHLKGQLMSGFMAHWCRHPDQMEPTGCIATTHFWLVK